MANEKSVLQTRIDSGSPVVLAEISPPASGDGAEVRALIKKFAGKVHGLGISDNRDGVTVSALAASAIAVAEGIEPIIQMTTRDRNRAALVSDYLGGQALGIKNFLCTSGTHQTLEPFRTSKNVFDIDATILLQTLTNLGTNACLVGAEKIGCKSSCLGAVASPYADPMELQLPRLAQKIFMGARFLVTQPVFDLDRFGKWWTEVQNRGLDKKAAFIAGIKVLTSEQVAGEFAVRRPLPMVTETILKRISSASNGRKEGIAVALETIEKINAMGGIHGFQIVCDEDASAAVEVAGAINK